MCRWTSCPAAVVEKCRASAAAPLEQIANSIKQCGFTFTGRCATLGAVGANGVFIEDQPIQRPVFGVGGKLRFFHYNEGSAARQEACNAADPGSHFEMHPGPPGAQVPFPAAWVPRLERGIPAVQPQLSPARFCRQVRSKLLEPVKNGSISAGTSRSQSTSRAPIGGDAVQTLYHLLLSGRNQRYSGSLQLFASENSLGTRSCPQIFRPARFGHRTKWSFRSLKYRSIAS